MMEKPRYRLDELVLVPATREQWMQTHANQLEHWGNGLTLKQFEQREQVLNIDSQWAKQAFKAWVLVPSNDPTTLDFVSSVETYRRPVYLNSGNGEVEERYGYSIASVFTNDGYRKQGFANHMMTLLHDELAKDSILSVLYSDVGDFYAKPKWRHPDSSRALGWLIISPKHVVWPVTTRQAVLQPDVHAKTLPLQREDYEDIATRDAAYIEARVRDCNHPTFSLRPTAAQFSWITERAKFYDAIPHPAGRGAYPRLEDWGVQLGQDRDASDWAFALWTFDLFQAELNIIRLRCHSVQQLDAIVQHALGIAAKYGMKKVTAWNVEETLLEGNQNVERDEHLPALAWYGDGPRPQWLYNEHWSWC